MRPSKNLLLSYKKILEFRKIYNKKPIDTSSFLVALWSEFSPNRAKRTSNRLRIASCVAWECFQTPVEATKQHKMTFLTNTRAATSQGDPPLSCVFDMKFSIFGGVPGHTKVLSGNRKIKNKYYSITPKKSFPAGGICAGRFAPLPRRCPPQGTIFLM